MSRNWRAELLVCWQQLPPVLVLFVLHAACAERALHQADVPYSAAHFYAWSFADLLAAFFLWMRYVSHRRAAAQDDESGYALPYGRAAGSATDMSRVPLPPRQSSLCEPPD